MLVMQPLLQRLTEIAIHWHRLVNLARRPYRHELHYMRGPGPKWRTKHQPWQSFDSEAVPPSGHHQLSPVYVRRRDAANPTQ
jgi:hypothetical protein